MEIGLVQKVDIDQEMQQAYLDYAMSVIVARALPDARDGLKPVHRRILYAMYDMGIRPDTPFKKSARIVGEVLGKYHPHGDMAVYEAMARMAQDFSMRYMLVDGQGNFGSVDGDSPAAMRYTEARLKPLTSHMLADIQKNTVDFEPNFDGTLTEPGVLPAAFPNLLVNGATGIAVGMSTSIPPHNLGEVVDALRYVLDNWEKLDDISLENLMTFIQGPDFPTGGIIIQEAGTDGLASAYGSGRGRVTIQARAHLEEMDRGRSRIIVTELPYMTNKSSLIERIATLVREERLEGISDLRDESDRHGMRIVIELSRGADGEKLLRDLYRLTPMQSTFSIIMLALVDGEPRMLSLKQALRVYLEHRLEIVRRRSEYDLDKAQQRAHILEGYRVALKNLDEVIDLIRKAPDVETARERLMKRFKLTEIQAQAILDLQLRRLAALERKKIEEEYRNLLALIKELELLLRSPKKMRTLVSDELQAVRETFGDARRTQIVNLKEGEDKISLLTTADLAPQKTIWISVSPDGLIARSMDEKLPSQSGATAPLLLAQASTRDVLYLVAENGEAAAIPVHSLPEAENATLGIPYHKVSALSANGKLVALFALPREDRVENWYVITATRQGMIKKSALSELPGVSSGTFTLARVNEGDRLGWVRISNGQAEILLVSASGMSIRFKEEEVRPMGLVAAGVMGIKLQGSDEIAGMELMPASGEIFAIANTGNAKRTALDQFPTQGRHGQGVILWKLELGSYIAGIGAGKGSARLTLHLTKGAPKVVRMDAAPLVNRSARGQMLSEVKTGTPITAITIPMPRTGPSAGQAGTPRGDEPPGDGASGGGVTRKRSSRVKTPSSPADMNGKPAPRSKDSAQASLPGMEAVDGKAKGKVKSATAAKESASPGTETPRKAAAKSTDKQQKSLTTRKPKNLKSADTPSPAPSAAKKTVAARAPAAKTPAAKKPVAKTPAAKTPAAKSPAAKAPAAKTPATRTPASKTPAAKIPAASAPAPSTPASKSPAGKTPAAKTPAKKKPVPKKKAGSAPA